MKHTRLFSRLTGRLRRLLRRPRTRTVVVRISGDVSEVQRDLAVIDAQLRRIRGEQDVASLLTSLVSGTVGAGALDHRWAGCDALPTDGSPD